MTVSMLLKFAGVLIISPTFILPGVAISLLGFAVGQFYMKAQLPVKREMSIARAPILGHFGAAITGLGKDSRYVTI